MSLSKALLGWKGNLTTFIPADYVLALRMDVNAFSDAAKELELENDELRAENTELRELVRDMWRDGMCDCDERGACAQCEYHCAQCEYHFPDRMKELGIEGVD